MRKVSETWNGVVQRPLPLQQVEMRNLLACVSRAWLLAFATCRWGLLAAAAVRATKPASSFEFGSSGGGGCGQDAWINASPMRPGHHQERGRERIVI